MTHIAQRPWLAVIDPIPYLGGSKIASAALLGELAKHSGDIEIYTRNPAFWAAYSYKIHPLYELPSLETAEQGLRYFAKHGLLALQLGIRLAFRRRPAAIVGLSGPGVDLSAYWCARWLNTKVVQCIHGPVANSRTIRRHLARAELIVALASELAAVKERLNQSNNPNLPVLTMSNGLPDERWPTPSQDRFMRAKLLWAASLLKWKNLPLFLAAETALGEARRAQSTICYIQPQGTLQATDAVPPERPYRRVFEAPSQLDKLRAECNIFVSTSQREPFGLSILEAMAAGLCVVIPSDGAYWDQHLSDGDNCIKYQANDAADLSRVLTALADDMATAKRIGQAGQAVAERYRASVQYRAIVDQCISQLGLSPRGETPCDCARLPR